MLNDPLLLQLVQSALLFAGVYLAARFGYGPLVRWLQRQEIFYDTNLRARLLMDIDPRSALVGSLIAVLVAAAFTYLLTESLLLTLILGGAVLGLPHMLVRHLAAKRRAKLEDQLVDALVTLASGVRAGLSLVQSIDLLIQNHSGPIQQEFSQLIREYEMGMDLSQAMQSASDRIGSPLYRLTFTALQTHRVQGGDSSQSLDRIAESVREIRRLEGKLDALTAQGRSQASMMAVMPFVFMVILYFIDGEGVTLIFTDPVGRLVLLAVVLVIGLAFLWIRKIMSVRV